MDCPQYLKQLEAVFPGSEDHEDPGVREAMAHLSECESCAREFEARGEFDRQVATRIRDVPVPAEARERLLQQLSRGEEWGPIPISPATLRPRLWRTLVWKSLVPAAVLLFMFGAWLVSQNGPRQRTMEQIQVAVAEQFGDVTIEQYEALDEFAGDFDAIDDGRWERVTNKRPRGIDLNDDGQHDAAVYWMRGPVQGVLLVLSPDLVSEPPNNTSPVGPAPLYSPVRVAWVPNGSTKVHLCVLNGDADDGDLRRLLRYVIDSMAA
jgi:hypothetical protein